jgi:hypothetical protein
MARVFTTTFEYNGEIHTAIVTQANHSVCIRVANESLQPLLPSEGLHFSSNSGVLEKMNSKAETEKLIQAIIKGLEAQGHMEVVLPLLREGNAL